MNDSQQKKSAIIAGMAPGFGAAIAKTLIADGYNVYGLSRKSSLEGEDLGASYTHLPYDLSDQARVEKAIELIDGQDGPATVLIYNAMQLIPKPFLELTPEEFQASWVSTCFGAMITARAVLPGMVSAGSGTVIFTGATAGDPKPRNASTSRKKIVSTLTRSRRPICS